MSRFTWFRSRFTEPKTKPKVVYLILPVSALIGLGLGLRLKAAALATASVLVFALFVALAMVNGWSLLGTLARMGASLVCLQGGFLAGAGFSRR